MQSSVYSTGDFIYFIVTKDSIDKTWIYKREKKKKQQQQTSHGDWKTTVYDHYTKETLEYDKEKITKREDLSTR